MPSITVNGLNTIGASLSDGEFANVTQNGAISGAGIVGLGDGMTAIVAGSVFSPAGSAIRLQGADSSVSVTGDVSALGGRTLQIGPLVAPSNAFISNSGTIRNLGSDAAVYIFNGGNRIVNRGEISANDGNAIQIARAPGVDPARNTIVNSGFISAQRGPVSIDNYAIVTDNDDDIVTNTGTIDGVVFLHGSNDRLVNTGSILNGVFLGSGDDVFDGRGGTISGLVDGGSGNDTITGDDGANSILGDEGSDVLSGGAGDDTIRGGADADTIDGGSGLDTADYTFSFGVDVGIFRTGSGGDAEGDVLRNVERIVGSSVGDTLVGGNGVDATLEGGAGNDLIQDYNGDSFLFGGDGADTVAGHYGNDVIYGGADADRLYGGYGDDTLFGGAGADFLAGGAGADTADYSGEAVGIDIGLLRSGTGGGATGDRMLSVERIVGTRFADTLIGGGSLDVTLEGGAGADEIVDLGGSSLLLGGDGADLVQGGAGDDTVAGGAGNDLLFGGPGADIFLYDELGYGRDLILDWQDGIDLIDLGGTGLTFADLTEVDTPQGTRLDRPDGSAIHIFGIEPVDITEADFV